MDTSLSQKFHEISFAELLVLACKTLVFQEAVMLEREKKISTMMSRWKEGLEVKSRVAGFKRRLYDG